MSKLPAPTEMFEQDRRIEERIRRVEEAWRLGRITGTIGPAPEVTALPTTDLTDGQEADLIVDSAGAYGGPYIWRFKYRAATAGTYKWHAIGPEPLSHRVMPGQTHPGGGPAVWADLATVGPLITVPFAGIYRVDFGATINVLAGADGYAGIRYGTGGANPVVTTDPTVGIYATASQIAVSGMQRDTPRTIAAATEVRMRYRNSGGGSNPTFDTRWLALTPVRLA
jgi:hypothetical protein